MRLDLQTLLWVLFIGCLGLALSVLVVQWRTRRHDGLSVWGWGLLVQAAAYPAFGLRMLDWHLLSLVLTNVLSVATLSLHLQAVTVFQREIRAPPPGWVRWGPLPLAGALAWLLHDDDVGRNVFGAIVMAGQSFALAWYAWSPGLQGRRERGRWLLVVGSSILLLMLLVRIVWIGMHPGRPHPLSVPSDVQSVTYLVVLLSLMWNTLGFVLMQKERTQSRLEESEERYRELVEAANEGICVVQEGVFRFVNPRFCEMSGYPAASLMGASMLDLVDPPERDRVRALHLARVAGQADDMRYELRVTTAGGEARWWEVGGVAIRWQGRPAGLNFVSDVTRRKALEDETRAMAFNDPLTGLPNRRLLMDRLQVAIAACRRSGGTGALMFIDLDRFKQVNDTFGHDAGDRLLVEVAARLQRNIRATDTVARFGGDEFVVLFPWLDGEAGSPEAAASALAEKLLRVLRDPHRFPCPGADAAGREAEHRSPGTIGVALFGAEAAPEAVMQAADRAMYAAKDAGRDAFRFAH